MVMKRPMVAFLTQLLLAIRSRFTRRARLEAENLILRQQLVVLRRKSPARLRLWNIDRLLLVWGRRHGGTSNASRHGNRVGASGSRWTECTVAVAKQVTRCFRRQLVSISVTNNPTAEWVAQEGLPTLRGWPLPPRHIPGHG